MTESTDQQTPPRRQDNTQRTVYEDLDDGYVCGNVTKEPSVRFTDRGSAICSLRLADTPRIKDDDSGEWKDGETSYYDVSVFGKQAENAAEAFTKGDRILAIGRWQRQTWQDGDGNTRSKKVLQAREIGPSLLFKAAKIARTRRQGG